MLPNKIRTVKDVISFFTYVTNSKLALDPDTDFNDYTNPLKPEKQLFNTYQANKLNALMEQAFDVCTKADVDIYELATSIQNSNSDLPIPYKLMPAEIKKLPPIVLQHSGLKKALMNGDLQINIPYLSNIEKNDFGDSRDYDLAISTNYEDEEPVQIGRYSFNTRNQAQRALSALLKAGFTIKED